MSNQDAPEAAPADPDQPGADLPERDAAAEQSAESVEQAAEPAKAVQPLFRVESGNPTPEDLAVLTLVLAAAASGGDEEPAPKPVVGWASPSARMRSIGRPGFGAWRAEAFGR